MYSTGGVINNMITTLDGTQSIKNIDSLCCASGTNILGQLYFS